MTYSKRVLQRVALDVFILLSVVAMIAFLHLYDRTYQRGFFCDDESLKHPYKDSTINDWMLFIIGVVIPIGMIIIVEIVKAERSKPSTVDVVSTRRYVLMGYEIPVWIVECYKDIGAFGFGGAVCQLITDIAKYSIGRFRPHFLVVCQPINLYDNNTICDDPSNQGKYIVNFRCNDNDETQRMLKEVRLSFPSGHASFACYAMVFTAIYLQSRMNWRGSYLLRHFLQLLLIMIAWYTSLSRVSDYKHHWSDVLAGSMIGVLTALIVINYVSDLFKRKSAQQYVLPRTSQDAQPQSISINRY